jgi:hypothetical protein
VESALAEVHASIPFDFRRAQVECAELDRFLFFPEDVVMVVGQDGLVANVAKYLGGQPVIGVDPEPGRNAGVLVPHPPADAGPLLARALAPAVGCLEELTMVRAVVDDGQRLTALNEVFVGHPTQQFARYRIALDGGASERQSSSGVLAGTGTGASGWLRSCHQERRRWSPTGSVSVSTAARFPSGCSLVRCRPRLRAPAVPRGGSAPPTGRAALVCCGWACRRRNGSSSPRIGRRP